MAKKYMSKDGKRKWCAGCNSWYRGKFLTLCNECYSFKRRKNLICTECKSPDCLNPVIAGGRLTYINLEEKEDNDM